MMPPAWPLKSTLWSAWPLLTSVTVSVPHGTEAGTPLNPKSNQLTVIEEDCGLAHVVAGAPPPPPPPPPMLPPVEPVPDDPEPVEPLDVEPAAAAVGVTTTPTPSRPFIPAPA